MKPAFTLSLGRRDGECVVTCLNCGWKSVAASPELLDGHQCRQGTTVGPKAKNPAAEQRGGVVVRCNATGFARGMEYPGHGTERPFLT